MNRKPLIYIDSTTAINNAESSFPIIRNEKVGCSIHLSGTNKNKHLAQPARLGFVVSGPRVATA
jgi:hypothetical protein